jgi:hypothetical protein
LLRANPRHSQRRRRAADNGVKRAGGGGDGKHESRERLYRDRDVLDQKERELPGVALAAVSLIAAVLAAAVGWLNPSMATVELAVLLTALALGAANHRRRWHQRWIK